MRTDAFKCPIHQIYISPSTFEYESDTDNLLWGSSTDLDIMERIARVKRESRMKRDNSEDAVTWNVFRFLQQKKLMSEFLSGYSSQMVGDCKLIFWSYSRHDKAPWQWLSQAREHFGETQNRGTEPDMIVISDTALYFIEAKFTSSNSTKPSNPAVLPMYVETCGNWDTLFKSSAKEIAVDAKKYELMRHWKLGSWIAQKLKVDFYLINLVLSHREKDIETTFGRHIHTSQHRQFLRLTWEDIYSFIDQNSSNDADTIRMKEYFRNKTIGYDSNRELIKAFSV